MTDPGIINTLFMNIDLLNDIDSFGMVFPDGWYGRPGDNKHRITWIDDRKFKLILEFDDQNYLLFSKSPEFSIKQEGSEIIFENYFRATLDALGYGDFKPRTKVFDREQIRLRVFQKVCQ